MNNSLSKDSKIILDKLEEGVIESEKGGTILYANHSACILLNIPENSSKNYNIGEFIKEHKLEDNIILHNKKMLLLRTFSLDVKKTNSNITTILDITDKMQNKKICTFVNNLGHEINNPNQFILSAVSRLIDFWKSIVPVLDNYLLTNKDLSIGGVSYLKKPKIVEDHLFRIMEGAKRINLVVNDYSNLDFINMEENNGHTYKQRSLDFETKKLK